ncbi:MAG: hypothetical protein QXM27_02970 [Candidatus Pacearchaeota archaeon]
MKYKKKIINTEKEKYKYIQIIHNMSQNNYCIISQIIEIKTIKLRI